MGQRLTICGKLNRIREAQRKRVRNERPVAGCRPCLLYTSKEEGEIPEYSEGLAQLWADLSPTNLEFLQSLDPVSYTHLPKEQRL